MYYTVFFSHLYMYYTVFFSHWRESRHLADEYLRHSGSDRSAQVCELAIRQRVTLDSLFQVPQSQHLYLLLGQYVSEAERQSCLSVEAMLSKVHAHSVGKPIAPQTKGRLL